MKKNSLLVILVILIALLPVSAYSLTSGKFSDISNHWSEQDVQKAVSEGFVNGYPDGTFRPERSVTRAEFVKMLIQSMLISPDSKTSKYLLEASGYNNKEIELTDVKNHWIMKNGWLKPALAFGLIVPSDYAGMKFEPDRSITRQEASVMVVRALGLVYPATHYADANTSFKDNDRIEAWVKGYIKKVASLDIIKGYPDGTFGGKLPITRAESVTIIMRALNWMRTGVDTDIKVLVTKHAEYFPDYEPQPVDLIVPAQVIDGSVYVPIRSLCKAASQKVYSDSLFGVYGDRFFWDNIKQQLYFEYGVGYTIQAGDIKYGFYTELGLYSPEFPMEARLYNGEVMVPIYSPEGLTSFTSLWQKSTWSPETKTLIITVGEPYFPIS